MQFHFVLWNVFLQLMGHLAILTTLESYRIYRIYLVDERYPIPKAGTIFRKYRNILRNCKITVIFFVSRMCTDFMRSKLKVLIVTMYIHGDSPWYIQIC